jgi:hypothetical protein
VSKQYGICQEPIRTVSKPPRVKAEELAVDEEGWATRHVVAQMKRGVFNP